MTNNPTSQQAFDRYEAVRHRFPPLPTLPDADPEKVADLGAITDLYDVFVFDAYGVLNVGNAPIPGACERIETLRAAGKRIFVLTNAASYAFPKVVEKFQRLGFAFRDDELISSRMICDEALKTEDPEIVWGVVGPSWFSPDELPVRCLPLGDDQAAYDRADAILYLSTECWTDHRHMLLARSLSERPRRVIAGNPDLVAPIEAGFSVEPGWRMHDLMDRIAGLDVTFVGKPFGAVYDAVEERLEGAVAPSRIVMMGDSLHTDIYGARTRGWASVLVSDHGFLKGEDPLEAIAKSGLKPDWIVPAI
ncbi:HAD-superfamily class IIA hydrolase, TIGR01459 [Cohaesibacter sp. ES.047]|uniref:HAD-IIA family hydrolase n=1 Tax=Cohaesibacter sp. ES.047 TaxID=1798205 RepID=UPI000BB7EE83|nr:HAD-IIA family hydrolase [Cohaesibacter sp. ES.047]SNY90887.1 HAD-superfamily class IIA hydrolase, TIGR01459 [Cohaesibacter sp. ES.047]